MEIKSFLIEEHKETIFDGNEIDKWKELVSELGLSKQENFINGTASPMPFPVMSEAQQAIYSEILESKESYKEFSTEAIPLQVLNLISFCEKESHFDVIQIWYSYKNPDPLVVGLKYPDEESRNKGYSWTRVPYLVAQWGAKIKSIGELLPIFDEFMRNKIKTQFDDSMRNHNEAMNKYKFQVNSFVEN